MTQFERGDLASHVNETDESIAKEKELERLRKELRETDDDKKREALKQKLQELNPKLGRY